jgi:uncharacterized protein
MTKTIGTLDTAPAEAGLDEARTVACEYSARVREHFGTRLRRVRLYGSAARGDWTRESDIDVLVLLDQVAGGDTDWLVREAVSMGLRRCGLLLQPLFMPERDFNRLRERERLFALEVEREGIEL